MFAALLRLVPRQQASRCSSPRLRFEVDIGQSLPVVVADDVAALVVLFDVQGEGSVALSLLHRLPWLHRAQLAG